VPTEDSAVSQKVNVEGLHNVPKDSHVWLLYRYKGEQKGWFKNKLTL